MAVERRAPDPARLPACTALQYEVTVVGIMADNQEVPAASTTFETSAE